MSSRDTRRPSLASRTMVGAVMLIALTASVLAFGSSGAGAGAWTDRLYANEAIGRDQWIQSHDRRFKLILQPDGNLVLYGPTGAMWSSGTFGRPASHLLMQPDGNLVIYDTSGRPIWASNTWGVAGAKLLIQNDGNLVMYGSSGPAWQTGTGIVCSNGSVKQLAVVPYQEGQSKISVTPTDTARKGGGEVTNAVWASVQKCVPNLYGPLADSIYLQIRCHVWATQTPLRNHSSLATWDFETWRPMTNWANALANTCNWDRELSPVPFTPL